MANFQLKAGKSKKKQAIFLPLIDNLLDQAWEIQDGSEWEQRIFLMPWTQNTEQKRTYDGKTSTRSSKKTKRRENHILTRIGYNSTKGNPSNKEATTIIFSSFLAGSL